MECRTRVAPHRGLSPQRHFFLQDQFLFLPFTWEVVVAVAVAVATVAVLVVVVVVVVVLVVVVVVVVVVMVAVSIEVVELVVVVAVVVVVEVIVSPKKVAVKHHFAVADGKFDVKHWQFQLGLTACSSVDLVKCPSSMLSFGSVLRNVLADNISLELCAFVKFDAYTPRPTLYQRYSAI